MTFQSVRQLTPHLKYLFTKQMRHTRWANTLNIWLNKSSDTHTHRNKTISLFSIKSTACRLWKETVTPGGNPCRPRENMQTLHRKPTDFLLWADSWNSNQLVWSTIQLVPLQNPLLKFFKKIFISKIFVMKIFRCDLYCMVFPVFQAKL